MIFQQFMQKQTIYICYKVHNTLEYNTTVSI